MLKKTNWADPRILKDFLREIRIVSVDSRGNYPILMDDGVYYSLNGKNQEGSHLTIMYNMKCPIIDGRIVSDKTFALRLLHFLEQINVSDQCGEEELEYLTGVSKDLLEWQISTVTSEQEKSYLRNTGIEI